LTAVDKELYSVYNIFKIYHQEVLCMEKLIPFEKLSKKKQKELNKAKRTTWGMTNPVTRREKNPRAYDRNKLRSEKLEKEFIFFCIKHILSADILITKTERADYI